MAKHLIIFDNIKLIFDNCTENNQNLKWQKITLGFPTESDKTLVPTVGLEKVELCVMTMMVLVIIMMMMMVLVLVMMVMMMVLVDINEQLRITSRLWSVLPQASRPVFPRIVLIIGGYSMI